jgi:hypothetical protein
MKSDLSKVKVGDKIWTIRHGWTTVKYFCSDREYPIGIEKETYTFDGRAVIEDKYPSAFLEFPFKEQPIEKDTLVYYRDDEEESWKVGYYSHFDNVSKKHWCFMGSKKSTETDLKIRWSIVTTENPLL